MKVTTTQYDFHSEQELRQWYHRWCDGERPEGVEHDQYHVTTTNTPTVMNKPIEEMVADLKRAKTRNEHWHTWILVYSYKYEV